MSFIHTTTWALAALAALAGSFLVACGGSGGSGGQGVQLSVSVSGTGTVYTQQSGMACGPGALCEQLLPADTAVTLSATPGNGQRFGGWGGDCAGSSGSTCSLAMSRARSVTAQFVAVQAAGWTGEVTASADGATAPLVAVDAVARGLLVWRQLDAASGQNHVWASRSASGPAWAAPERVDGDNGNVADVRLAMDPASGRAMAVWVQQGSTVDLWARPYDPQAGWGAAARVDTADGMVGEARVGMDAQGQAVAVWSQVGPSTRWSIYASRRPAGGTWTTPALLENNEVVGSQDSGPALAVAASGEALVAWNRANGAQSSLWGSRLNSAGSWSTAAELVADSGAQQSLGRYDLAVDRQGNGLLAWGQWDLVAGSAQSSIRVKRHAGGAWQSTAAVVHTVVGSGYIAAPLLNMHAGGAAVLSWTQADGSVLCTAAAANGSFATPLALRGPTSASAPTPATQGLDAGGGLSVAWTDPTSQDAVLRSRPAAGSWSAPQSRNQVPGSVWGATVVAVNDGGDVILAWQQLLPGQGTRVAVRRYFSGN